MSFADSGVRTVLSGIGPVTVTFAGAVVEGGLVGYSSGWVAADGSPTVAARFVAAKTYASGAVGVVYQMARVNGFTGGTPGNTIYLSDTAGYYSDSAGSYTQSLGFMVTATEAIIMPFDLSGATMATISDASIALAKLANLTSTYMIVGSSGNVPTARQISGDITMGNTGIAAIGTGVIINTDVNAAAAIDYSKLATLTDGYVLVGSALNVPTAVAMSGDVTILNTGATAIGSGVILNADVNAAAAIAFSKLATLTSGNILVGSAGGVPTSVAMSGDVTLVAAGTASIASDVIVNADINTAAAIAHTKLAPIAAASVLMGAVGNIPTATAITGDIGITNAGVVSITSDSILNADINTAAAIAYSKLATLADGNIVVGSGTGVATSVAMSGDVTIVNTGVTTIGAGTVHPAMLAANSRRQTVRMPSWDIDVAAGGASTRDEIAFIPQTAIEIKEIRIVYDVETSGTVAAGSISIGSAAAGEQIVAAVGGALENTKAVGYSKICTPVEYTVAADTAIFVRLTGVAATAAGWIHVEIDYETTD